MGEAKRKKLSKKKNRFYSNKVKDIVKKVLFTIATALGCCLAILTYIAENNHYKEYVKEYPHETKAVVKECIIEREMYKKISGTKKAEEIVKFYYYRVYLSVWDDMNNEMTLILEDSSRVKPSYNSGDLISVRYKDAVQDYDKVVINESKNYELYIILVISVIAWLGSWICHVLLSAPFGKWEFNKWAVEQGNSRYNKRMKKKKELKRKGLLA